MEIHLHEAATQWAVFLISLGADTFFFGWNMCIRVDYSKGYFLKEVTGVLGPAGYHLSTLVGSIFMVPALVSLPRRLLTRRRGTSSSSTFWCFGQ